MADKLNTSQVLLLDQSTLKAPLDQLRKQHKLTSKTWEHNLAPTSTFQTELDSVLATLSPAAGEALAPHAQSAALASVDSLLSKMRALKRKLGDLSSQSAAVCAGTDRRLAHLDSVPPSMTDPAYPPWARRRLNLQLAEHWLRADPPLRKSADALVAEQGLEGMMDGERWEELAKCEAALGGGQVGEAMKWAGENRAALRKLKSPLEFSLHLQSFIELCRGRKLSEAIWYSRQHLSGLAVAGEDEARLGELQNAMSLLAFPETTTCPAYQLLYSPARWDSLRSLFRSTFLSLHSLPPLPLLHMSLQAGLAALKTGACIPLAPSPTPSPTLSATSTATLSTVPIMHNGFLVPSLPPTPSAPPPRGIALPRNGSHGFLGNDLMYRGPAGAGNLAAAEASLVNGGAAAACPICSSPLKVLAGEVPYSHHVNSTVVCRISGRVVEGDGGEGGQLVAMVGHQAGAEARVYSKEGLASLQSAHPEGKLLDPRTGEEFGWGELKKVFIS